MRVITRNNQLTDIIYEVVGYVRPGLLEEQLFEDDRMTTTVHYEDEYRPTEAQYFFTPDGKGRFYYDTLAEAQAEHGPGLYVVTCVLDSPDS